VELLRRGTSAMWPPCGQFWERSWVFGVQQNEGRARSDVKSSAASKEEGGRGLLGERTRPPLGATVRRAQGLRICHRCLPTRRLAERVVSPPKVLGPDTPKDTLARPVLRATGWPARGLRRLYHILMGAVVLKRAKPRSVAGGDEEGVQRPWWRRTLGVRASVP
jgi:hypothetical protein